jgi:hypothetical protein
MIKMAKTNNDQFFSHVLSSDYILTRYKALVQNGISFNVGFSAVSVIVKNQPISTGLLPVSTSAIMKAPLHGVQPVGASPKVAEAVLLIRNLVNNAYNVFTEQAVPSDKALEDHLSAPASAPASAPVLKVTSPPPPAPVVAPQLADKNGTAIPLSMASKLAQPVLGTSSVYYVGGIGPRLKIAFRAKGNTLSVRAEGKPTSKETSALVELGFDHKTGPKNYWSVHFSCADVPLYRVMASFLFHPDIELHEVAQYKDIF